jgi:ADP-heptose:LPS heptosyltransferase
MYHDDHCMPQMFRAVARNEGFVMPVNALIVNFSGLGDGLIEIPLLKNMEAVAPNLRYYHTGGVMFTEREFTKALDLSACLDIVPATWRKFDKSDWSDIAAFIEANKIELIINFRNLGPDYDMGFFAFKENGARNVEYLNYDFDCRAEPTNIRNQMRDLLNRKRIVDNSVNWLSLRRGLSRAFPVMATQVGINMHSGSRFKLWPYEKWRAFCCELLTDGEALKVFPGFTDAEVNLSVRLVKDLENHRRGRTMLIKGTGLGEVLGELADTKCLVSADSWPLHAAAGLGVKAIGLYIVTSPVTWGVGSDSCVPVESAHLKGCEKFDAKLGFCRNGYVECPLIKREGDGIEIVDVLRAGEWCDVPSDAKVIPPIGKRRSGEA